MLPEHKWQFYTDSESVWDAMLQDIQNATTSIDLEQFILSTDSIGIKFIEALKDRATHGVKVRILCDEVGSYALSRSPIVASIVKSDIEIKFFNSIVPWNPNNEAIWYFRDHRKLLVVDGRIGYTGGVCIGEEMRSWRESSVRIEGQIVSQMLSSFEVMWQKSYRRIRYYLHHKNKNKENPLPFRYITNAPLPDKHYLYKEIIKAIKSARRYVYLTTPYLLPDSRLLRTLKRAVRKGVEVKILVPHTADHTIIDIGMSTFFRDMLEHRIKIFRYPVAQFIHAKTAVIDGIWGTIGSMNMDNLSLRYNFEGNIVSTDKSFISELERQFLEDIKISPELTLPVWQNRGFFQRILEATIWPIRKFL